MIFKPRIFISSVLSLVDIREKIKEHFASIGAEAILYEKDLTPSINPNTYRNDILDTDFVIFIFDERYGSETDSGKSGTHEEWEIVSSAKKPCHIYINKCPKERDKKLDVLINKEINPNVSYYYFETEYNLLERIKATSFQIAHEIVLDKLDNARVSVNQIRRLAIKKDIDTIKNFIRPMEEILKTTSKDLQVSTNIFQIIIKQYEYPHIDNYGLFVDRELNKAFDLFLNEWYEFKNKQNEFYYLNTKYTFSLKTLPNLKNIDSYLVYPNKALDEEKIYTFYNRMIKKYKIFKNKILKLNNDKLLLY